MAKSKRRSAARKPDWRKSQGLHPSFPLFPHQAGYWAKKVKGKLHYFGKIADDPKGRAALDEWDRTKNDLMSGRSPRPKVDGITVAELCDRFLQAKDRALDAGEITTHTRRDYHRVTDRLVKHFGQRVVVDLTPEDFEGLRAELANGLGPVATGNAIQRARVVFKYASDNGLIPRPVLYGSAFKRPSRKVLRIQRAKQGRKLFSSDEVRQMLGKATLQLKAMILLAANCGLGNGDCATLEYRHLDFDSGWLEFPRPKTGIDRRVPLWSETVQAVRDAIAKRRTPKDKAHANLIFVTAALGSFKKDTSDNPIAKEFAKLAKALQLQQLGRGFYSLRHTFRTVADAAKDQPAANSIMGHADESMAGIYRERIDDERLKAVTDHVHGWLFATPSPAKKKPRAASSPLRIVG